MSDIHPASMRQGIDANAIAQALVQASGGNNNNIRGYTTPQFIIPLYPTDAKQAIPWLDLCELRFLQLSKVNNNLTEESKVMEAGSRLAGDASAWFTNYEKRTRGSYSWADFRAQFIAAYTSPTHDDELSDYLHDDIKFPNNANITDAVRAYKQEFDDKMSQFIERPGDEWAISAYLSHLPEALKGQVRGVLRDDNNATLSKYMTKSIDLAATVANEWRLEQQRRTRTSKVSGTKRARDESRTLSPKLALVIEYCKAHKLCFGCKQPMHPNSGKDCTKSKHRIPDADLETFKQQQSQLKGTGQ